MQRGHFILTVNSADPEGLQAFYRDVVGLTPQFEFAPGAFSLDEEGPPVLIVEGHSEVTGSSAEPQRLLLNFLVQDAVAELGVLRVQGVEIIRDVYEEEGAGIFATFADPDGNYCQLIQLYG